MLGKHDVELLPVRDLESQLIKFFGVAQAFLPLCEAQVVLCLADWWDARTIVPRCLRKIPGRRRGCAAGALASGCDVGAYGRMLLPGLTSLSCSGLMFA